MKRFLLPLLGFFALAAPAYAQAQGNAQQKTEVRAEQSYVENNGSGNPRNMDTRLFLVQPLGKYTAEGRFFYDNNQENLSSEGVILSGPPGTLSLYHSENDKKEASGFRLNVNPAGGGVHPLYDFDLQRLGSDKRTSASLGVNLNGTRVKLNRTVITDMANTHLWGMSSYSIGSMNVVPGLCFHFNEGQEDNQNFILGAYDPKFSGKPTVRLVYTQRSNSPNYSADGMVIFRAGSKNFGPFADEDESDINYFDFSRKPSDPEDPTRFYLQPMGTEPDFRTNTGLVRLQRQRAGDKTSTKLTGTLYPECFGMDVPVLDRPYVSGVFCDKDAPVFRLGTSLDTPFGTVNIVYQKPTAAKVVVTGKF